MLVEDLRSRSNLKGLFTKYFYLSNLAETSFPQIVFFCFICVFVYQCILYLCLSTCLVIQVWASGETLGGLHCTAPSTVGVFSALGAGTGSFTLLNNRVRKKSIPFSPFQFYIPKAPETTFMYLSFEPWHKEGLPNAGGAKELYGQ